MTTPRNLRHHDADANDDNDLSFDDILTPKRGTRNGNQPLGSLILPTLPVLPVQPSSTNTGRTQPQHTEFEDPPSEQFGPHEDCETRGFLDQPKAGVAIVVAKVRTGWYFVCRWSPTVMCLCGFENPSEPQ